MAVRPMPPTRIFVLLVAKFTQHLSTMGLVGDGTPGVRPFFFSVVGDRCEIVRHSRKAVVNDIEKPSK